MLQCFHTFCQACLEKVQDHPDRVNCPGCHHDTPLGSGGVAGLLSDYGITGLMEISGSSLAGGIGKSLKFVKILKIQIFKPLNFDYSNFLNCYILKNQLNFEHL